MKFVNPCPTEEALTIAYTLPKREYDKYFQSDYIDSNKVLGGKATWQQHYAHEYLGTIEKKLGYKGRIFELGCGSGIFLEMAHDRGWDTAGADFGDWRQNNGFDKALNIRRCSVFEGDFGENSFDAVYMSSVLEHLQDPTRYLEKMYSILKPGGIICATGIPNVHSLTILLGVDRWIGNHPPIHLLFFSRKTAGEIFRKTGFRNIETNNFGLSETILEAVFNRRSNVYTGEYASLVYQKNFKGLLIRQIRFIVYRCLDLLGIGSVLEIFARK